MHLISVSAESLTVEYDATEDLLTIESLPIPASFFRTNAPRALKVGNFTEKQRSIMRMIGEGIPQKEIAARMNVSPKTISTHKQFLMEKLDAKDNADLTVVATLFVLITPR